MKNFKRVLAIIGVVLLVGLYALTLISSFMASPHSHALFLASLYSTIIIPIFLYAMILVYKLTRPSSEKELEQIDKAIIEKDNNKRNNNKSK